MDGKQFHLRSRLVVAALAAVLLTFAWVLYDLQVVHGSYYLEQSTRKIANTETVQAARGEILDRYGRVLVSNRAGYQVTLDTKLMGNVQGRNDTVLELLEICREQGVAWSDTLPVSGRVPFGYTESRPFENVTADDSGVETTSPSQLRRLADILKLKMPADPSAKELVAALRTYFEVDEAVGEEEGRALVGVLYELALRSKDVARTGYVFAQDVDIQFITAVKERGLAGVKIETVTVRQYETASAAHLLGQVGPIYAEEWDQYKDKGYSMNDTVGKDGVEAAFESVLRGTPGVKDIELNQSGKIVSENWHVNQETGEVEAPAPGDNVMLTVDIKLQEVVEEALERHVPGMTDETEGAACVVTDMTGGVLAMASYPGFDPATYSQDFADLRDDPLKPLLNRALQGLYAPGSTIKMAVAAGALEEGAITRTEKILDTGRYKHYDRIQDQPMCWYFRQYGRTHGWENVSEAIRDSCNVFFYETGLRMGIEKIDTYAALFGLGQKTGLELYEEAGEVAGPEVSAKHGQTWYEGDTMYAAIGQGNTKVTPIQLANYIATLVNGGSHYPTHLLKTVKSSDFSQVVEEYRPEARDEINLDPANLEAVKYGMGMVASEGSAAGYFKDLGVKIGVKTGTAQVARNSEANALLVAFAPYDNPEIAVSLVVEKGGSGTLVAAIAAEILDYYFSAKDTMDAAPVENTLTR
ncbi:hypothetical protein CE91St43_02170 [Oscillospiraceae bacterium]|nr:hypothetical protein CE91St43_02170 [Oscillospiraceae bacterium]